MHAYGLDGGVRLYSLTLSVLIYIDEAGLVCLYMCCFLSFVYRGGDKKVGEVNVVYSILN